MPLSLLDIAGLLRFIYLSLFIIESLLYFMIKLHIFFMPFRDDLMRCHWLFIADDDDGVTTISEYSFRQAMFERDCFCLMGFADFVYLPLSEPVLIFKPMTRHTHILSAGRRWCFSRRARVTAPHAAKNLFHVNAHAGYDIMPFSFVSRYSCYHRCRQRCSRLLSAGPQFLLFRKPSDMPQRLLRDTLFSKFPRSSFQFTRAFHFVESIFSIADIMDIQRYALWELSDKMIWVYMIILCWHADDIFFLSLMDDIFWYIIER